MSSSLLCRLSACRRYLFLRLLSSVVQIAGIQLGSCPTWPLRTLDFLRACSQVFLSGFSSIGKKYFVWQVRIHRRNDRSEPIPPACSRVRPLCSCFHGLRDICVGQKEQGPCFQSVALICSSDTGLAYAALPLPPHYILTSFDSFMRDSP